VRRTLLAIATTAAALSISACGGGSGSAGLSVPEPALAGIDGSKLYAANCASCHRTLGSSKVKGASGEEIKGAITGDEGGMRRLDGLSDAEIVAISRALNGLPMIPAPSSPTPPTGTALYQSYCEGCHGPLASSSVTNRTTAGIQGAISANRGGMSALSGLTQAEIQMIAAALSPSSPGATPTPPPTSTPTPTPPAPLPGKAVYDGNCSGCHRLGSYDAAGSAPDLSGKGALVGGKFTAGVSGHMGRTLSAQQISDVKAFLNAN
jgi:mono/diheme cytochrome c family protein